MAELIEASLRPVTEEDRKRLPKISYSNLSTFEHCPLQWKFKYKDKMFSDKSSLAMEIGTILHAGLEMKADYIKDGVEVDYTKIEDNVMNGCDEVTDKCSTHILGIEELKKKYFEEWYEPDKFGRTYDQKLIVYFTEVLPSRMEDSVSENWEIVGCEIPFEFVYDDRVRVSGFIDRVDRNTETGEYRVVDYKSSKKVFPDSEIKTPLQMFIYDCAVYVVYGRVPTYHEYDFILLNQSQATPEICTKGYLKRAVKKVNKLLDSMDGMLADGTFNPKATPLCYWCNYHSNSPNSDPKFKGVCQYHSLWTPTDKNFKVLNEWNPNEQARKNNNVPIKPPIERKLIF